MVSFQGKKTLNCHLGIHWDSHAHLSVYKNRDFKYICTSCSRWLETEKSQKYYCDRDRLHYTISLAIFRFPFFILKRSQSQGLGIRQLVSAMQRQLFIFLVHDCCPSHTAERQSNPEILILYNSVVWIPSHSPAKEFQWNLNSRLVFLAIHFLICKRETSSKDLIVFTNTS